MFKLDRTNGCAGQGRVGGGRPQPRVAEWRALEGVKEGGWDGRSKPSVIREHYEMCPSC